MPEVVVRETPEGFSGDGKSPKVAAFKKLDWAEGEEKKAKQIFKQVDKDGDGVVTIRELIIAIRKDENLADTLKLPSAVRQEDGTRDQLEKFFQKLDTDGDRTLTFDEFSKFFADNKDALDEIPDGDIVVEKDPSLAKPETQLGLPEPSYPPPKLPPGPLKDKKPPSLLKQLSRAMSKDGMTAGDRERKEKHEDAMRIGKVKHTVSKRAVEEKNAKAAAPTAMEETSNPLQETREAANRPPPSPPMENAAATAAAGSGLPAPVVLGIAAAVIGVVVVALKK